MLQFRHSFVLIFFLPVYAYGQDAVISDFVNTGNNDDLYIIGGDEKGFFTGLTEDYYYQGSNNKQVITYYDTEEVKEVESVIIKPDMRSREIFYTFSFQNQLHTLVYDNKSEDDGLFHMYLNSYDRNMQPVGDEKDLDQIYPYIFSYDLGTAFRGAFSDQFGKMRRATFISHKPNPAGDKVALFFDFNYFNAAEANFQALVLDKNREAVWSGLIDLPDDGGQMLLEDYVLDNEGNLYILMMAFDNKNFRKTASEFEYRLFKYEPQAGEAEEINLQSDGKFVINMGLDLDRKQHPVLAGVYANPNNNDVEGGILIRPVGNAIATRTFAFDDSMRNNINEKDKDKAEEYTIKHVVLDDDGSAVFFAESYHRGPMVTAKLKLSAFNPLDTDVEMGDIYKKILAVKMAYQPGQQWVRMIDKNQRSAESKDVYASFALAYDEDAYYLVFNNEIKNASDVSMVSISKGGDIELKPLLDRREHKLRLVPEFARMPAPGILTVPVEKSRKQAVLRLKF
ncbi:MAG: hypothetical protein ACLFT3_00795 [Cyclobacteriaceae bacterium]